MSHTSSLASFPLFPSESGRTTIHAQALTSVEHEGIVWLIRSYNSLLFFKRETDTQGDAIFVLTETLDNPTPEQAIQLWKKCFPNNDWARFGVRQWEGVVYHEDDTQHDLCFLLVKSWRGRPTSIRITTDLSNNLEDFECSPEDMGLNDNYVEFLSVLLTKFKSLLNTTETTRRNLLLSTSFEDLVRSFSTQQSQHRLVHAILDEYATFDESVARWRSNLHPFYSKLLLAFPVECSPSVKGEKSDFESLIRWATLTLPSAEFFDERYYAVISCKTPFLPPKLELSAHGNYTPPDYTNNFTEITSVILDYFEPTGYEWEADHETVFSRYVPINYVVNCASASNHEKVEARLKLKEWLKGKIPDERIESLLAPPTKEQVAISTKGAA